MGNALGKMTGKVRSGISSVAQDPAKAPMNTDRKLTPPFRAGSPPRSAKPNSQLAVEAQNRGLGGKFREPINEMLNSIGRYK